MAEKGFGVKEINLIGASGTPTIESPNNLNLNAVNVAISTNATIGGTLAVTGNVSVGGTLTYEDVTSIDSVGIITARSVIHAGAGLTVVGVSTFNSDVHFGLHGAGNPKVHFDESSNLLWFKAPTAGGTSSKLWLGNGTSYNNLELVTDYTGGGLSQINVANANLQIATNSAGKNITVQSQNDLTLANGVYPFIKGEKNSGSDQSVTLYHGQTGSTPYANPKLETSNTGVVITGICTATSFSGSGASLTNLPVADSDIQVAYTVTANGTSAYRFAGNGVVSTADDPDLYLIRGKKYRFINNSGGSHPFQIRESSGGTAYSTGVTNNGASSGNIDFAPTFDSPAQLVYQCTSHGGMVGNIYLRGGSGNETNVGVTTFTTPTGWVHGTETSLNGNVVVIENGVPDGASHIRYLFRYVSVNSTSQPFCQIELNNNGTIKNSNFQTASTTTRSGSPQISGDERADGLTLWNGYTNAGNILHGVLNIYRIGTNGTDGTNYYMEFHGMGNSSSTNYDATHSGQGYFELGTGSTDYVSGLRLSTGNGSVQFDNGYIQQSYILS